MTRYAFPMNLYLSHITAFRLWRAWSAAHPMTLSAFHDASEFSGDVVPSGIFPTTACLRLCAVRADDIEELAGPIRPLLAVAADEPLHILVAASQSAHSDEGVVRHRLATAVPRGAFLRVLPKVYVASPELVFVQMGALLTFGELLGLGYELCGCYPLSSEEQAGWVRCPLSTPRRLLSFSRAARGLHGAKRARAVAAEVLAKSASPMETELAAAAFTSARRGGLGLERGLLNYVVPLATSTVRATGCQRAVGDIVWPGCRKVVEYDGVLSHRDAGQQARDARKRDALVLEGYESVTVTASQFYREEQCVELLDRVSMSIDGRRRRHSEGHRRRHHVLREQVHRYHQRFLP